MKKNILGKLLIGSLAALLVTCNLGGSMHKIKAEENIQENSLEDDETLVKGGGSNHYVLNKNYSIFSANAFSEVVHNRVAERVKIWDVENNLKADLNKQRQQKVKHYEGYHLMTNEERDDMANAAKQHNISLKQYLRNCGIDLSDTLDYMTTACGGPNRIWHYGDASNIGSYRFVMIARDLYFEKYNISNNHHDNTLVGKIDCTTEDCDRFLIPFNYSKSWKFIYCQDDHLNEFINRDYLMLYVKN